MGHDNHEGEFHRQGRKVMGELESSRWLATGGLCYTTKVDNETKVRKGYHCAWQIYLQ
jgi:hypothetical protein